MFENEVDDALKTNFKYFDIGGENSWRKIGPKALLFFAQKRLDLKDVKLISLIPRLLQVCHFPIINMTERS